MDCMQRVAACMASGHLQTWEKLIGVTAHRRRLEIDEKSEENVLYGLQKTCHHVEECHSMDRSLCDHTLAATVTRRRKCVLAIA